MPPKRPQLVGRLVFGAVFFYLFSLVFAGAMTPSYRHSQQLISELGEIGAPYSWLWRTTLIVSGILVTLLAQALDRAVGGNRSKWGPALVAVIGVGLVLGGIFQCDPTCAPKSFSGWMHILTSIPASFAALAGPFIFARRLDGDSRWRRYARASRIFGWLSVITIASAFFAFPACGIPGIGQRVATFTQLAWLAMMAWALTRESREGAV